MICVKCLTNNFVFIGKIKSQKNTKQDQLIGFNICKKCEPILASMVYLDEGYSILVDLFSIKNLNSLFKKYSRLQTIFNAYDNFYGIDKDSITIQISQTIIKLEGLYNDKTKFSLSYIKDVK